MSFQVWLEKDEKKPDVLCHVAGPSGCGKTTLVDVINRNHKHVTAKDLDDFDAAARNILGWSRVDKGEYKADMFDTLHKKCQELLDDFLGTSDKPVVLAGHSTEGGWRYRIATKHKFAMDVDPDVVARRLLERGKDNNGNRLRKMDAPHIAKDAAREIENLMKSGYDLRKPNEILGWIKTRKPVQ